MEKVVIGATATSWDAYRLLRDGAVVLAEVEAVGMKIDTDYLDRTVTSTQIKIDALAARLRADPVYDAWRGLFGTGANLSSPIQFRKTLNHLGYYPKVETKKGRRDSVNATALEALDLPFAKKWTRLHSLEHTLGTYLIGLRDETVDGYYHPNFNQHVAVTYRMSSGADRDERDGTSDFNSQNVAGRNPETSEIVRTAFVPRKKGYVLTETDFKTLEVAAGACLHRDKNMVRYLSDPKSDMHRDVGADLFFLTTEQVTLGKETVRDAAKNGVVFPMFYGSVWFQCAPAIWERMTREKWTVPGSDLPLKKHLRRHGVKGLGDCTPGGEPGEGTFAHHVRNIEYKIWNKMFPGYRDWKKATYEDYLKTGEIRLVTGFVIRSQDVQRRNQVVNTPIQGPASHCNLLTTILLHKWLKKYRMKTRVVNLIHDSMVKDGPRRELRAVKERVEEIVAVDLPKIWDWITVPLRVEIKVGERSWFHKRPVEELL